MKAGAERKKIITGFGGLMIGVLLFTLFFRSNFLTVEVSGNSMLTTFRSGQRLLATRAYWLVGNIHKNDIVVFQLKPGGEHIIKRVYALGGEEVDWLNAPRDWQLVNGPFKVPSDDVYVLGDNRPESEDSRFFGPIKKSMIVGKVVIAN